MPEEPALIIALRDHVPPNDAVARALLAPPGALEACTDPKQADAVAARIRNADTAAAALQLVAAAVHTAPSAESVKAAFAPKAAVRVALAGALDPQRPKDVVGAACMALGRVVMRTTIATSHEVVALAKVVDALVSPEAVEAAAVTLQRCAMVTKGGWATVAKAAQIELLTSLVWAYESRPSPILAGVVEAAAVGGDGSKVDTTLPARLVVGAREAAGQARSALLGAAGALAQRGAVPIDAATLAEITGMLQEARTEADATAVANACATAVAASEEALLASGVLPVVRQAAQECGGPSVAAALQLFARHVESPAWVQRVSTDGCPEPPRLERKLARMRSRSPARAMTARAVSASRLSLELAGRMRPADLLAAPDLLSGSSTVADPGALSPSSGMDSSTSDTDSSDEASAEPAAVRPTKVTQAAARWCAIIAARVTDPVHVVVAAEEAAVLLTALCGPTEADAIAVSEAPFSAAVFVTALGPDSRLDATARGRVEGLWSRVQQQHGRALAQLETERRVSLLNDWSAEHSIFDRAAAFASAATRAGEPPRTPGDAEGGDKAGGQPEAPRDDEERRPMDGNPKDGRPDGTQDGLRPSEKEALEARVAELEGGLGATQRELMMAHATIASNAAIVERLGNELAAAKRAAADAKGESKGESTGFDAEFAYDKEDKADADGKEEEGRDDEATARAASPLLEHQVALEVRFDNPLITLLTDAYEERGRAMNFLFAAYHFEARRTVFKVYEAVQKTADAFARREEEIMAMYEAARRMQQELELSDLQHEEAFARNLLVLEAVDAPVPSTTAPALIDLLAAEEARARAAIVELFDAAVCATHDTAEVVKLSHTAEVVAAERSLRSEIVAEAAAAAVELAAEARTDVVELHHRQALEELSSAALAEVLADELRDRAVLHAEATAAAQRLADGVEAQRAAVAVALLEEALARAELEQEAAADMARCLEAALVARTDVAYRDATHREAVWTLVAEESAARRIVEHDASIIQWGTLVDFSSGLQRHTVREQLSAAEATCRSAAEAEHGRATAAVALEALAAARARAVTLEAEQRRLRTDAAAAGDAQRALMAELAVTAAAHESERAAAAAALDRSLAKAQDRTSLSDGEAGDRQALLLLCAEETALLVAAHLRAVHATIVAQEAAAEADAQRRAMEAAEVEARCRVAAEYLEGMVGAAADALQDQRVKAAEETERVVRERVLFAHHTIEEQAARARHVAEEAEQRMLLLGSLHARHHSVTADNAVTAAGAVFEELEAGVRARLEAAFAGVVGLTHRIAQGGMREDGMPRVALAALLAVTQVAATAASGQGVGAAVTTAVVAHAMDDDADADRADVLEEVTHRKEYLEGVVAQLTEELALARQMSGEMQATALKAREAEERTLKDLTAAHAVAGSLREQLAEVAGSIDDANRRGRATERQRATAVALLAEARQENERTMRRAAAQGDEAAAHIADLNERLEAAAKLRVTDAAERDRVEQWAQGALDDRRRVLDDMAALGAERDALIDAQVLHLREAQAARDRVAALEAEADVLQGRIGVADAATARAEAAMLRARSDLEANLQRFSTAAGDCFTLARAAHAARAQCELLLQHNIVGTPEEAMRQDLLADDADVRDALARHARQADASVFGADAAPGLELWVTGLGGQRLDGEALEQEFWALCRERDTWALNPAGHPKDELILRLMATVAAQRRLIAAARRPTARPPSAASPVRASSPMQEPASAAASTLTDSTLYKSSTYARRTADALCDVVVAQRGLRRHERAVAEARGQLYDGGVTRPTAEGERMGPPPDKPRANAADFQVAMAGAPALLQYDSRSDPHLKGHFARQQRTPKKLPRSRAGTPPVPEPRKARVPQRPMSAGVAPPPVVPLATEAVL